MYLAREATLASEHLEGDAGGRIDVGLDRVGLAITHLGCRVDGRMLPADLADLRRAAEVADADGVVVVQEQIGRFEIVVDDAFVVDFLQGLEQRDHDFAYAAQTPWAGLLFQYRIQSRRIDPFHDDGKAIGVRRYDIVNGDEILPDQGRGDLDLGKIRGAGVVVVLDRHNAIDLGVLRPEHLAKPTLAHRSNNFVAISMIAVGFDFEAHVAPDAGDFVAMGFQQ